MRGLKLFGMLAMAATLVLAAVSCKEPGQTDADLADVLEAGEDLSGTWKVADGSKVYVDYISGSMEYATPEKVCSYFTSSASGIGTQDGASVTLEDETEAEAFFKALVKNYENNMPTLKSVEAAGGIVDYKLVINGARDKITYITAFKYTGFGEYDINVTIKKQ